MIRFDTENYQTILEMNVVVKTSEAWATLLSSQHPDIVKHECERSATLEGCSDRQTMFTYVVVSERGQVALETSTILASNRTILPDTALARPDHSLVDQDFEPKGGCRVVGVDVESLRANTLKELNTEDALRIK